jgi:hypothetical protein
VTSRDRPTGSSNRLVVSSFTARFLWASLQAERLSHDYDAELLDVGVMFHDVGLLDGRRSEDERVEIDTLASRRDAHPG